MSIPAAKKIIAGVSILGAALLLLGAVRPGFAFAGGATAQGPEPGAEGTALKVSPEEAKKVVAKVNGVEITMGSVLSMAVRMSARKGHGASQPQDAGSLRKEALDRLIFQELAFQEARTEGMTVAQKDIDGAVAGLKAKLGSEEEYRAFLTKEALTEGELRSEIEKGLTVRRIVNKKASEGIALTEDDLRKEYEKVKGSYFRPEKMTAVDIVFFLDTQGEDSRRKAEEVLRKVRDDAAGDPMKLTPDGTFAVREVEISKEKEKELYETGRKLKPGELSGIVVTPDSLQAIKLKEYTPAKQFTFEEVRGSVGARLKAQAQVERLREWQDELRKRAKIEILDAGDDRPGTKGGKQD
ncbi:MAG: SurA N-terminal domain-containing protein [Nitrospirae bacterium]|nr:SurA N-terminal domain-containing protein [Nitrospirota bacterium]